MRLLLDQGLPRSAVGYLIVAGHDTKHVGDLGMASASDAEILSMARRMAAVVVTLDADFHQLLATGKHLEPSVIRLRVEGLKGKNAALLIVAVIETVGSDLESGAAVSVTERDIRVRRLPIP
jgi:predicted nuclease of predicted toxin-antitoxin system